MSEQEYQQWFYDIYTNTHPIVQRAGKRLLARFCLALSPELEDLISEAYLTLHKKREKLVKHPNVTGWLIVALKYIILKRMRKWARNRDALLRLKNEVEVQNQARKADLDFDNFEDMEILRETLGRENFELLRAYHVEGVPVEELARKTGRSINATYMKISRLRRRGYDMLNSTDLKSMIALWMSMNFLSDWFK